MLVIYRKDTGEIVATFQTRDGSCPFPPEQIAAGEVPDATAPPPHDLWRHKATVGPAGELLGLEPRQ